MATSKRKKTGNMLEQLRSKYAKCYHFTVKKGGSIHNEVNSEKHKNSLPTGYCKMVLYNPDNDELVFPRKSPRETGTKLNGQNIFTYFNNTGSKDYPKSQQIQEEMKEDNIEKIEVVVFWDKI